MVNRFVGEVRRLRLDNAALQAKVGEQQVTIQGGAPRTRHGAGLDGA